ncbi:MAG: D-aminoacylase [Planctomycetes bacterium]|nr:D-aminoacylase [Planctomycetota bacterium]
MRARVASPLVPCLASIASLAACAAAPELTLKPTYDLVLRGGRIVDGTGNPWFHGDVAVQGDRIALVGAVPAAAGRREIDVKGLVVAPGFIDIHSHSDTLLFEDGDAQSKVRQGVTTEVLGESTSGGPAKGKLPPRSATARREPVQWSTLGGYLDALERSGVSVNVASYVGLGTLWRCVLGDSHARPSSAELEEVKALLDEAMREGAFGLSSMVAAPPDMIATTGDLIELCGVVARHGGIYSTHIRNEGEGVFEALGEAIEVGEKAGVPVDVIHLKIADRRLWGRMGEVVALLEGARARGVNVQANVYPYTRGNNDLATIAPPWAHEGGRERFLGRLADPAARERMVREIREGIPGWYDHYLGVGGDWSRILVNAALGERNKRFEGQTMDRIIAERSKGKEPPPDPFDVLFDLLIEEGGFVSAIYAHHTEEDMTLALAQPWCSVGSDGSAYAVEGPTRRGVPHPRSFGTFPRVLGVFVRERRLLRLEDAVRKMTSLNAAKLGLRDRGLLRPGAFADIAVFDPEAVADRATYAEPFQYPAGIEHVIVNGTLVIERGRHTGARPGRALRRGR